MKYFVVFGNPITHTKSPQLFNTFFYSMGIPARYSPYCLELSGSPVQTLKKFGFLGANVTIPFKEVAFKDCDEIRGAAKEIGSVNTLIQEGNKVIGYNTDAEGFYRTIARRFIPKNALIVGAGGSAKAIAYILKQHGINIIVVNRSYEKLEFFAQNGYQTALSDTFNPTITFDLVINATNAGLQDDILPLSTSKVTALFQDMKTLKQCLVYDIVYGKTTPFFALAQSLELPVIDGSEMLVMQAALSGYHFLSAMNIKSDKEEIFQQILNNAS